MPEGRAGIVLLAWVSGVHASGVVSWVVVLRGLRRIFLHLGAWVAGCEPSCVRPTSCPFVGHGLFHYGRRCTLTKCGLRHDARARWWAQRQEGHVAMNKSVGRSKPRGLLKASGLSCPSSCTAVSRGRGTCAAANASGWSRCTGESSAGSRMLVLVLWLTVCAAAPFLAQHHRPGLGTPACEFWGLRTQGCVQGGRGEHASWRGVYRALVLGKCMVGVTELYVTSDGGMRVDEMLVPVVGHRCRGGGGSTAAHLLSSASYTLLSSVD